jgi:hypothetical protein
VCRRGRRAGRAVHDDGTGRHRRPFIYFPLRRHWEQQHFVTHRLDHYRAGLRMDYATTTADDLATAMRTALGQNGTGPGFRKVPRDGAGRAAASIAPLLAGQ